MTHETNIAALFTFHQPLHGPIVLTSNRTDEDVPTPNGQLVSATVAVKVEHLWNDETWYRFKHGVFIDGEWMELSSNKDRENYVIYLSQNEDDDKIDGLMEQYDKDHINYQTHHPMFDINMMKRWKEHAVDIETKFKAVLSLGIIAFPPTF